MIFKIGKYVVYDLLRTRFTVLYTLFLAGITVAFFQLDTDSSKVVLSLLNIVLMVVPLVSIVFTTIHFFNSYEFIELMLSQPINRSVVFFSEFLAMSLSQALAFMIGVGIPLLLFGIDASGIMLLFCGVMLTFVFVALAFLASVLTRDKAKAIGVSLLFWFYFSLLYDGILLWIIYTFSDYPLDEVTLVLVSLNPIDLARIIMLMSLDISALMGYTGAFYKDFFGSSLGLLFSGLVLMLWVVLPVSVAFYIFKRKDL